MNNLVRRDYTLIIIVSFLLPSGTYVYGSDASWKNAVPVAAFFGGLVGGLAIAKLIVKRPSVTSAINNRIAFPLHQRFHDEEDDQLDEAELREYNRQVVEKTLTSLISRTQKRLAIIGGALAIAAATKNEWWNSFANHVGWIQARTEFGMSMLYYFDGPDGMSHPLFSSPIRESLWISAALLYTQFVDVHRSKELADIYDFPEYVFIWLSYLYEIGRIDS